MSRYRHDCEAEEALFRDQEGADRIARDVLRSPMKKIDQAIPNDDTFQRSYNQIYEEHFGHPPDYQVTKQDVMAWAEAHPSRRTTDVELLSQRCFLDNEGFGELSREIKPPHKQPPIQSIFKCHNSRQIRRSNLERRQMEQSQGNPA